MRQVLTVLYFMIAFTIDWQAAFAIGVPCLVAGMFIGMFLAGAMKAAPAEENDKDA